MVVTSKSRSGSLDRWIAASERSIEERIRIVPSIAQPGDQVLASSGTDPRVFYMTDGTSCSCPAGAGGDPVCKHRAAYRRLVGDPTPRMVEGSEKAVRCCDSCHGRGRHFGWYELRGVMIDMETACWSCDGAGWVEIDPVVIVR